MRLAPGFRGVDGSGTEPSVVPGYDKTRRESRRVSMSRSSCRGRSAERYVAVVHLHRDRWQRLGGRSTGGRTVRDLELALVARALDQPVLDAADRAALMGALGRERLEFAGGRLGDHHLLPREDLATADRHLRDGAERV